MLSIPVIPRPVFAGGGKKSDANRSHTELLHQAGITKETMAQQGVVLWRSFQVKDMIVFRVDSGKKKLDTDALKTWLETQLKTVIKDKFKVMVRDQSIKGCCSGSCRGCFQGDKSTRKSWIG